MPNSDDFFVPKQSPNPDRPRQTPEQDAEDIAYVQKLFWDALKIPERFRK